MKSIDKLEQEIMVLQHQIISFPLLANKYKIEIKKRKQQIKRMEKNFKLNSRSKDE